MIHIGTGDARMSYLFEYGKVRMQEAIPVEQETGLGLLDLVTLLPKLSPTALTAVIWLLRKREEPDLRFEDVDFALGDVDVEPIEDEETPAPKDDASEIPAQN